MLEVKILEVSVTQMGFAIVLQPPGRKKVVPIFIGPLETYSISSALEDQKSERPMTHDLVKAILVSLEYRVSRVVINNFKNGTFYARLFISNSIDETDVIEVDARPSDSIALAVRFGASIFMDEDVYDKVSVDIDLIKDKAISDDVPDYAANDENLDNELIQTILDEFSEGSMNKSWGLKNETDPASDDYKSKREVLEEMLKVAVKNEKYEDAAKLRDEITRIRKKIEK